MCGPQRICAGDEHRGCCGKSAGGRTRGAPQGKRQSPWEVLWACSEHRYGTPHGGVVVCGNGSTGSPERAACRSPLLEWLWFVSTSCSGLGGFPGESGPWREVRARLVPRAGKGLTKLVILIERLRQRQA